MKIIINNKIKLEKPSPLVKDILVEKLKHKNPRFIDAEKMGKSTYKIPEFLMNFEFDANDDMYIPRGMRQFLFSLLDSLSLNYTLKDERTHRFIYLMWMALLLYIESINSQR